jgi:hypothetical protein
MEFARLNRERPASYAALLADPFSDEQLKPCPMSPADCEYFQSVVDPAFQCVPIGDSVDESGGRSNDLAACLA